MSKRKTFWLGTASLTAQVLLFVVVMQFVERPHWALVALLLALSVPTGFLFGTYNNLRVREREYRRALRRVRGLASSSEVAK